MSNRSANQIAGVIDHAFAAYHARFKDLTARARVRFELRDWRGAQRDAADRLALYKHHVDDAVAEVQRQLPNPDLPTWGRVKDTFSSLIADRDDSELAETFFNSVTRRVFTTVGVNPQIEYLESYGNRPKRGEQGPIYDSHSLDQPLTNVLQRVLRSFPWTVLYEDAERDGLRVAQVIARRISETPGFRPEALDMVCSVFYRNKGAYLVGRLRQDDRVLPLVLPLVHSERGIAVDAALTTSDEASIVFGFSWSYFRVDAPRPRALVHFLRSLMPLKRVDELYTSIGYNKHGKTLLYRSLLQHLDRPEARFEFAEGEPGLVMSVFTLPSFNVVFKIIRDRFAPPKRTTRRTVMDKYHFVFVRDRAGRLADAQEFEHLEFRRACFSEALLTDLLETAANTVRVDGDRVIVRHLYTERRVTPLNLYLREASEDEAHDAVIDYGHAIKDLAASNIFTGDMLLKNFGVSRHGRVICYDYDELALLTDCNFRRLPQASTLEDEFSAEPWFFVGEQDVFPEEFSAFLVPPGRLREAFLQAHGDLLGVDYWRDMQRRQAAGEIFDIFPYRESRRFDHGKR